MCSFQKFNTANFFGSSGLWELTFLLRRFLDMIWPLHFKEDWAKLMAKIFATLNIYSAAFLSQCLTLIKPTECPRNFTLSWLDHSKNVEANCSETQWVGSLTDCHLMHVWTILPCSKSTIGGPKEEISLKLGKCVHKNQHIFPEKDVFVYYGYVTQIATNQSWHFFRKMKKH